MIEVSICGMVVMIDEAVEIVNDVDIIDVVIVMVVVVVCTDSKINTKL